MNRLLKSITLTVLCFLVLFSFDVTAQISGKQLYDLMEDDLEITEGITKVSWLPNGMGYFEYEIDPASGKIVFYRIDAENQNRKRLFDREDVETIVNGYNSITGKSVTGLPFDSLEYVLDNKTITFEAGDAEFLYNFDHRQIRPVFKPVVNKQPGSDDLMRKMHKSQLWTGTISPDYNSFAYVIDYDIYIYNTKTKQEERLTFGGHEGQMNGRPSWVYPEELDQRDAYWFSPDSKKIAFLQYYEQEVHQYPIIHELDPEAELELERYPKSGETNPTVRLFIVDIETKELTEIETNSSNDIYITRIIWLKNGSELLFQRLNRFQNRLELLAGNVSTGKTRTILIEEEETFIELHDDINFIDNGERFIWSSERNGWRHLYIYDLQGNNITGLTEGEWETHEILLVDEKEKWIYFDGYTNNGFDTHFFRVKFDGSKLTQLTTEAGQHEISIDPAGKYYIDKFSSLTVPPTVNLYKSDGKLIRNLAATNIDKVKEHGLSNPEFVRMKTADGITDVYGLLFKPADFDPDKLYPLIVSVYGGPSKKVENEYLTTDKRARLAQLGFIVWELDGRGTLRRGKEFLDNTYLKFGQIDVDDQAAGVRQITERSYIDGNRVGMYGCSYGGYMTCMSLLRFPDVYHVGVAGSSVTDWRNYDTIYTERFMRTPQANPDGYLKGSALTYVDNLKGHLLLTHGTVDNNVHPGNTTQLMDELQRAGKKFDLMLYPENRHKIGRHNRTYSEKIRVDYFLKHLKPDNWEDNQKDLWENY